MKKLLKIITILRLFKKMMSQMELTIPFLRFTFKNDKVSISFIGNHKSIQLKERLTSTFLTTVVIFGKLQKHKDVQLKTFSISAAM